MERNSKGWALCCYSPVLLASRVPNTQWLHHTHQFPIMKALRLKSNTPRIGTWLFWLSISRKLFVLHERLSCSQTWEYKLDLCVLTMNMCKTQLRKPGIHVHPSPWLHRESLISKSNSCKGSAAYLFWVQDLRQIHGAMRGILGQMKAKNTLTHALIFELPMPSFLIDRARW